MGRPEKLDRRGSPPQLHFGGDGFPARSKSVPDQCSVDGYATGRASVEPHRDGRGGGEPLPRRASRRVPLPRSGAHFLLSAGGWRLRIDRRGRGRRRVYSSARCFCSAEKPFTASSASLTGASGSAIAPAFNRPYKAMLFAQSGLVVCWSSRSKVDKGRFRAKPAAKPKYYPRNSYDSFNSWMRCIPLLPPTDLADGRENGVSRIFSALQRPEDFRLRDGPLPALPRWPCTSVARSSKHHKKRLPIAAA